MDVSKKIIQIPDKNKIYLSFIPILDDYWKSENLDGANIQNKYEKMNKSAHPLALKTLCI
ncbi:hypothetical protein [Neptunomonas qingdaonensis]|uniref:Uncharacterized protein n=1 Tax=Neptunomonas qingdaonensis TaxID=1045558 RepID=A0A1I2TUF1_9GAMM|nr:hypothetical protein [Neptunomonas qingdaonensis]SFG68542.1 hypothetical protein SAMN05216175_11126 [Neptunomonas qingdaonensis]